MVQHYLSLMLTAVNEGKISLERVVETSCANPAKLCNVYGKKGVITPGADADLVVLDMDQEVTVKAKETFYKVGWTTLDGRKLKGVPTLTALRGRVIFEDGKVSAEPGFGQTITPPVGG
jgi:dihydroorotase-like cyclic amidohydrolase